MRIVVLLPKLHAGSELAMNRLLKRRDLNIVGLVRSDVSLLKKQYWKYIIYGVRRAGLFYGFLIGLMAYLHIFGVALAGLLWWRRRRKWRTIKELVREYNLSVYETENVNSAKSVSKIKSWNPDVIVTLFFDQILGKEVIEVPKIAALNMHPGLLPKYRGLWPEFWNLKNKEKYTGVTIHYLSEKVDAGDIIAQMKFSIKKDDTKFGLALKSAKNGAGLLISTLLRMKKIGPLKIIKNTGVAKYYSLPTKVEFVEFYAKGKRLFSFTELFKKIL